MKFNIGQSSSYRSEDRYNWAVWIDEEQDKLKEVKSVTYYLHKTFPDPIRKQMNREDKFVLKTSGWGTFMIYIDIELNDGEIVEQEHYLILEDDYHTSQIKKEEHPSALSTDQTASKKKIFLSYSTVDQPIAEALKNMLKEKDIEVTSAADTPAGISIYDFIKDSMKLSDAVIEIPTEYSSSSQESEIRLAENYDKKVIRLPKGGEVSRRSENQELNSMNMDFLDDIP